MCQQKPQMMIFSQAGWREKASPDDMNRLLASLEVIAAGTLADQTIVWCCWQVCWSPGKRRSQGGAQGSCELLAQKSCPEARSQSDNSEDANVALENLSCRMKEEMME